MGRLKSGFWNCGFGCCCWGHLETGWPQTPSVAGDNLELLILFSTLGGRGRRMRGARRPPRTVSRLSYRKPFPKKTKQKSAGKNSSGRQKQTSGLFVSQGPVWYKGQRVYECEDLKNHIKAGPAWQLPVIPAQAG